MWNKIASSKYLQSKYALDNLEKHYSNLYDIEVTYQKRRPQVTKPVRPGAFILSVEKDKKQKLLRRMEINNQNKK